MFERSMKISFRFSSVFLIKGGAGPKHWLRFRLKCTVSDRLQLQLRNTTHQVLHFSFTHNPSIKLGTVSKISTKSCK